MKMSHSFDQLFNCLFISFFFVYSFQFTQHAQTSPYFLPSSVSKRSLFPHSPNKVLYVHVRGSWMRLSHMSPPYTVHTVHTLHYIQDTAQLCPTELPSLQNMCGGPTVEGNWRTHIAHEHRHIWLWIEIKSFWSNPGVFWNVNLRVMEYAWNADCNLDHTQNILSTI